jgi:UDP-GlcNAc:undecaprenyl-phosphate/decaprenyl-phosphate GlcNAc-1-phosphate transferase
MNIVFYIAAVIIPFVLNLITTPIILRVAHRFKWYDDIDHRKIHSGDIPRLGGVGIFLTTLAVSAVFVSFRTIVSDRFGFIDLIRYLPFLAGCLMIHLIGLFDDFSSIRPIYKLLGQIAAGALISFFGFSFPGFVIPFTEQVVEFGILNHLITTLWIVGVMNAINFIDGLDGLCGGLSAISALFIGISAIFLQSYTAALISFFLLGSILGFLKNNLPPAKLFMGDSGSLFIGYVLACLPLFAYKGTEAYMGLFMGATFILIPLYDMVAAVIRRVRKRLPPHHPDKEHIHHKLLDFGLSTRQILAATYIPAAILSLGALWWAKTRTFTAWNGVIILWLLLLLLFVLIDGIQRKRHGRAYFGTRGQ